MAYLDHLSIDFSSLLITHNIKYIIEIPKSIKSTIQPIPKRMLRTNKLYTIYIY